MKYLCERMYDEMVYAAGRDPEELLRHLHEQAFYEVTRAAVREIAMKNTIVKHCVHRRSDVLHPYVKVLAHELEVTSVDELVSKLSALWLYMNLQKRNPEGTRVLVRGGKRGYHRGRQRPPARRGRSVAEWNELLERWQFLVNEVKRMLL